MARPGETARVSRLRIWILVITLVPGMVAAITDHWFFAAGLATGGIIVVLNLMGTQRTISLLIEGEGIERIVATLVWFVKFGITATAIFGLLYMRLVEPIALLVGLGALPVSIVFDIFLFPVDKGEAKNL